LNFNKQNHKKKITTTTINHQGSISYDKNHDSDDVVLFFCFLQDFSSATREASVLAEEALHPMKLRLSNFNKNIKVFVTYCRVYLCSIIDSGVKFTCSLD
jgi:hypothetical protein